jgi:hypothetical protein
LKPHYDTVAREMSLQVIPDGQLTKRFILAREAARNLGHVDRFSKAPLAVSFSDEWNYQLEDPFDHKHSRQFVNAHGQRQGTCIHLGNCDIGCDVRAKNGLDVNYIPRAEQRGAEVRPLHLVRFIEPRGSQYCVVFDRLDNDGWHAFLSLLAKTPEDARAIGGVKKAWDDIGNKAISMSEIDYADILRERAGAGESATWDRILSALKDDIEEQGGAAESGAPGSTIDNMLALADDPDRLVQFAQRLQDVGKARGDDSIQQRKSLLGLMHGLANYTADRKPAELDSMLDRMAGAAAQLPPDMLLTLITDPPPLQCPCAPQPGRASPGSR